MLLLSLNYICIYILRYQKCALYGLIHFPRKDEGRSYCAIVMILLYMMMIYFLYRKVYIVHVPIIVVDLLCSFTTQGAVEGLGARGFVCARRDIVFVYIFYCAKGLRVRSSVAVIIVHTSIISH